MARDCAVLILMFVTLSGSQNAPVCKNQINSCSCETDQGLIDLKPLDSNDPNAAKFRNVPDTAGDSFAYNPCSPFTDSSSFSCIQVAACQSRAFDSYNIGEQSTASFETDPTDGLRIKYTTTDASGRTTYVSLKCDGSQDGSLTAIGEDPPFSSNYKLTLTSKYCCPGGGGGGGGGGGLSVGSILLIIFSVLIVVYLLGGVVYNKFVKGASGFELIPNVEFWQALPGLIKDGCLFIWRCITGKTSGYEEQK